MREARSERLALALVVALSAAAYAPTVLNGFAKDDDSHIVDNRALDEPALWVGFLFDARTRSSEPEMRDMYRPLAVLSWAVQVKAAGREPWTFHLVDVLLHALNAGLVYRLARRRFSCGRWASAAAAALFALHPAQVESVSHASAARVNAGSLAFALAAFALHLEGRRAAAAAALGAALLFKEVAVSAAALIFLHDWAFGPRERLKRRLSRWSPYLAVTAAFLAARALDLRAGGWSMGLSPDLARGAHGLIEDLKIMLWPSGLSVCRTEPLSPSPASTALAAAALSAFAAAGAWALRRRRPVGFCALWVLVGLAPVSQLLPIPTFAAERFAYFPLVGAAWGLALALNGLSETRAAAACAALALLLLPATLERQFAWKSAFTIDEAACAARPGDPCGPLLLASHYFNWRMLERSESLVDESLRRGARPGQRRYLEQVRALIGVRRKSGR